MRPFWSPSGAARTGLVFSVLLLCLVSPIAIANVPFGFSDEEIAGGFLLPVGVIFDDQGRMIVWEKRGIGWLVESDGTVLPTPIFDLSAEVHAQHDKGMLGVVLDPDYATNGYIYFLYNVDPILGEPDEHPDSATWGRVARYTVVDDEIDTGTRLVLLGNDAADGIPNCHNSHAVGSLIFGHDGSLFVSGGDGAHYDFTDEGIDRTEYDPQCDATFGSAADIGALRSQTFDTLAGKILRIDPLTGDGYADNPWYDGDLSSIESRSWAMGLRNPFRVTIRPLLAGETGPGTLYAGDVGWTQWEEMNVAHGGENFGWPCYEGVGTQGGYQGNPVTGPFCQGLGAGQVDEPLMAWHHGNPGTIGFVGNCAAGAAFYDHTNFPSQYHGTLFFVDYGDGWIRNAVLDENHQLVSHAEFATALTQPVDVKVDPNTGDLVYVQVTVGNVRRIRNTLTPVPPIAVADATPKSGPLPLDVQFSSDGTFDPNGDPFTLEWDFGDGSPTSSAPNPLHQYTTLGEFTATLIATDDGALSDTTTVMIQTINLPPTVSITSPPNLYQFEVSEVIPLAATASDPEDGMMLSWAWEIDLIHNDHPHPNWITSSSPIDGFVAETHGDTGDRYSYRVRCIVTDTGGEAASDTTWVSPLGQAPNHAPVASFSADHYQGIAPLLVQFDASNSLDPDDDLMIMDWGFGDGTVGSGLSTSHIYGSPGLYPVTLTVHDSGLAMGFTQAMVLVEPDGLLGCWPFDENGGGTAFDSGPFGYDATLYSANWVAGAKASAVDFDGTSAYVGTGQSFLSNRGAFALSAWINPRSTGNRVGLIGQNDCIEFGFISTANLNLWTVAGGNVSAAYMHPMGEWHHVIAQGDGTSLELYVDGILASSSFQSTGSYGSSGYAVNIGGGGIWDAQDNWFDGTIDDVRIYDHALSPAEIAIVAATTPPNLAPVPDAGLDGDGVIGAPFALVGGVSDDGNPAPPAQTTSQWTQLSGPPSASLFSPTALFSWVEFTEPGSYIFQLQVDDGEQAATDQVQVDVLYPTGVPGQNGTVVSGLYGVAPNPVQSRTTISFGVARPQATVKIAVYGVDGRRVATLYDGNADFGVHHIHWGATDSRNASVASGVYFLIADIDGRRSTRKLTVVR